MASTLVILTTWLCLDFAAQHGKRRGNSSSVFDLMVPPQDNLPFVMVLFHYPSFGFGRNMEVHMAMKTSDSLHPSQIDVSSDETM
ncbi:hypothetical protein BO94DRAFT_146120 [Aspergillus sclerotioniger CBS 115572]|uniref:Uncharacterized protein n=1 Tax=Aspergillus sclerotioniger CBS 115572 TaxID=1450535 RepID=A0A317W8D2_9EURO|nr:hypothetical protein BO94DRAFT_146120 [Aspergillus sclerotioniger CBS 115572]PWY81567.1 hypothetical protein BO94DRAFT_146120 [Aspergillus sclerotioniger CBS 115572]